MSEYYNDFKGTCPVDRRIFETEWFCQLSNAQRFLALFLLIRANFTDKPSNKIKTVIKRGQWAGSVGTATKPGTLMNETGLPYSTIVDGIKKLLNVGFIKKEAVQGCYTIFSIPEYDLWTGETERVANRTPDRSNKRKTDSNKEKEIKPEEDDGFEDADGNFHWENVRTDR